MSTKDTKSKNKKFPGQVSAYALIALLTEPGKVSNKEIAALVGVAPYSKDSGKKTGKRSVFGGRELV